MIASRLIYRHQKIDRFYLGLVHEIAGPAQSGKSYICYMELITYLHKHTGLAVIVDTNRTFSPAVLSALIKERGGDSSMLDRIVIVPCLDIIGVVEAIQGVMASYRKDTLEEHDKIGMVLIDNITNPISMLMQNGRSQGHDLMVCLARDLTLLSRLYSVCILVVNSTIKIAPSKGAEEGTGGTQGYRESAFADVRIKPALGSTWPHLMDFCLFIHPIPEDARRVPGKRGYIQEVIRSRVGGVGEWTVV